MATTPSTPPSPDRPGSGLLGPVRRLPRALPGTAAAVVAAAVAGGLVTDPRSAWYRGLEKPPWQPPGEAFGLVWTPLYAAIAGASAVVLDRLRDDGREGERTAYRRALAVNLTLNAGWSAVFFGLRRPGPAVLAAAALAASSADLARRSGAAGAGPRRALVPYAAWTTFATALNASIWRRNRS